MEHQQLPAERTIRLAKSRQIVHGVIAATTRRREYSIRLDLSPGHEESHLRAQESVKSIPNYIL